MPTHSERRRRNAVNRIYHATGRDLKNRGKKGWIGQAKLLRIYNQARVSGGRPKKTWKQLSAPTRY